MKRKNNWYKINKITRKVKWASKKRAMLGFLLTLIFLAFMIPGVYLLADKISNVFTIKNIVADNFNPDPNIIDPDKPDPDKPDPDKPDREPEPPKNQTIKLVLDGNEVEIKLNDGIRSLRLQKLFDLATESFNNFVVNNAYLAKLMGSTKIITYENLLDENRNVLDNNFIQSDIKNKIIIVDEIKLVNKFDRSDGQKIDYNEFSLNFSLDIINTHKFYYNYLNDNNIIVQSSKNNKVINAESKQGLIASEWFYFNDSVTGKNLYDRLKQTDVKINQWLENDNIEFPEGSYIQSIITREELDLEENNLKEQQNKIIKNDDTLYEQKNLSIYIYYIDKKININNLANEDENSFRLQPIVFYNKFTNKVNEIKVLIKREYGDPPRPITKLIADYIAYSIDIPLELKTNLDDFKDTFYKYILYKLLDDPNKDKITDDNPAIINNNDKVKAFQNLKTKIWIISTEVTKDLFNNDVVAYKLNIAYIDNQEIIVSGFIKLKS